MDSNERFSTKRRRLEAAMKALTNSDAGRIMSQYYMALLDYKLGQLISSAGEEATTLKGELRCLKHLLSVLEQGDTPLTDSIKTQIIETA